MHPGDSSSSQHTYSSSPATIICRMHSMANRVQLVVTSGGGVNCPPSAFRPHQSLYLCVRQPISANTAIITTLKKEKKRNNPSSVLLCNTDEMPNKNPLINKSFILIRINIIICLVLSVVGFNLYLNFAFSFPSLTSFLVLTGINNIHTVDIFF